MAVISGWTRGIRVAARTAMARGLMPVTRVGCTRTTKAVSGRARGIRVAAGTAMARGLMPVTRVVYENNQSGLWPSEGDPSRRRDRYGEGTQTGNQGRAYENNQRDRERRSNKNTPKITASVTDRVSTPATSADSSRLVSERPSRTSDLTSRASYDISLPSNSRRRSPAASTPPANSAKLAAWFGSPQG